MGGNLRVLLAEDVAIVRKGLKLLLSASPEIAVCAEAADGHEAVELAAKAAPDAVLMDLSMPGLDGLEAIAAIRRDHPDVPVIALTAHMEPGLVACAIRAGASGYLLKNANTAELSRSLKSVASGGTAFCGAVFRMIDERAGETGVAGGRPLPGAASLRVVETLAQGLDETDAARELGMSPAGIRALLDQAENLAGGRSIRDILLYCMSALAGDASTSSPDKAP